MIFDLFHSISDVQIGSQRWGASQVYDHFLSQVQLAEALGMEMVWLAESHFSSQTQKQNKEATIPCFEGEVGLNADSFQTVHWLIGQTKKIGLGTAIHNIVGGSGGPIASAEKLKYLDFLNEKFYQRTLKWGVASGRFPYQNTPFGVAPRNDVEKQLWPLIKRGILIEATEIFLRLLDGQELSSAMVAPVVVSEDMKKQYALECGVSNLPDHLPKRWEFEKIALGINKGHPPSMHLEIILGTADPLVRQAALPWTDFGVFNLSFTPAEKLEALHKDMQRVCQEHHRQWHRHRLPRTVMVFIHPERKKAYRHAEQVVEVYRKAMEGTVVLPPSEAILSKALVGDASEVRDQLHPENPRKFHPQDRLMLWFEFNQLDQNAIKSQMKYFMEEVAPQVGLHSS